MTIISRNFYTTNYTREYIPTLTQRALKGFSWEDLGRRRVNFNIYMELIKISENWDPSDEIVSECLPHMDHMTDYMSDAHEIFRPFSLEDSVKAYLLFKWIIPYESTDIYENPILENSIGPTFKDFDRLRIRGNCLVLNNKQLQDLMSERYHKRASNLDRGPDHPYFNLMGNLADNTNFNGALNILKSHNIILDYYLSCDANREPNQHVLFLS